MYFDTKGKNLDISICVEQIIQSLRACLARPDFMNFIVAFSASGAVDNT